MTGAHVQPYTFDLKNLRGVQIETKNKDARIMSKCWSNLRLMNCSDPKYRLSFPPQMLPYPLLLQHFDAFLGFKVKLLRARTSCIRWRRGDLNESLVKEESEGLDIFLVGGWRSMVKVRRQGLKNSTLLKVLERA